MIDDGDELADEIICLTVPDRFHLRMSLPPALDVSFVTRVVLLRLGLG